MTNILLDGHARSYRSNLATLDWTQEGKLLDGWDAMTGDVRPINNVSGSLIKGSLLFAKEKKFKK